MSALHKVVLYGLLVLLALSLVIPGGVELFKARPGIAGMALDTVDARNQFRAMQGMIVGIGLLAVWAALDLDEARSLVLALGVLMAGLVAARLYSLLVDGMPGFFSLVYLAVEWVMALVFLLWPPPR